MARTRGERGEKEGRVSRRQALRRLATGVVGGALFFVAFGTQPEPARADENCGVAGQPDFDCGTTSPGGYTQDARCGMEKSSGGTYADAACGAQIGANGTDPDDQCGTGTPTEPD